MRIQIEASEGQSQIKSAAAQENEYVGTPNEPPNDTRQLKGHGVNTSSHDTKRLLCPIGGTAAWLCPRPARMESFAALGIFEASDSLPFERCSKFSCGFHTIIKTFRIPNELQEKLTAGMNSSKPKM